MSARQITGTGRHGQQPLRAVAQAQRWTLASLGREIGVSQISLRHWANGRFKANPQHVAALVEVLGVPADQLFTWIEP